MNRKERTKWGKTINKLLTRPEFIAAWEGVGEAGIGTDDSVKPAYELLRNSDYHNRNIKSCTEEALERAADWADGPMTDDAIGEFYMRTASQLRTIAAVYLVIGAAVGFCSGTPGVMKQDGRTPDAAGETSLLQRKEGSIE